MLSVFYGLLLVDSFGCRNLLVEVDSAYVVILCRNSSHDFHTCRPIISAIHQLCSKDWIVEINHVFHEANFCADSLAKHGHQITLGLSVFNSRPSFMSVVFSADLMGCSHEKVIAI